MDTFVHRAESRYCQGQSDTSKERREGVSDNQMDWFQGAGDQGVMIGYACDETPQLMPMPVVLANQDCPGIVCLQTEAAYIEGICPDGKAQVTVEYEDGKPVRLDSVVVSCQHTEDKRSEESWKRRSERKCFLPALRPLPPDEETKILYQSIGAFCLRRTWMQIRG